MKQSFPELPNFRLENTRMINYQETKEFKHDLKKLLKSFSSLKEDLQINKRYQIGLFHLEKINNRGIFCIEGAGNTADFKFYKVKKFQCKSLKGFGARSGLRIIYVYLYQEQKIVFLEIYFKGRQKNCQRERMTNFIDNYKK